MGVIRYNDFRSSISTKATSSFGAPAQPLHELRTLNGFGGHGQPAHRSDLAVAPGRGGWHLASGAEQQNQNEKGPRDRVAVCKMYLEL